MLMSAIKLGSWPCHEIWETVAAEKVKKSRLLWVMTKSHLFLAAAATVSLTQP